MASSLLVSSGPDVREQFDLAFKKKKERKKKRLTTTHLPPQRILDSWMRKQKERQNVGLPIGLARSKFPRNGLVFDPRTIIDVGQRPRGEEEEEEDRRSDPSRERDRGRRHAFDACHVHISERTTTRHSFSLFLPPPPRQAFHQVRCTPSHRFSSRPPSLFALYLIDNRPPENDTRPAISYFVRREHDRRWIILRLIVGRYFVSWIVELKISLMTDRIYVSIYLDKKIYEMNISNVRILQFVFCQEKL